MAVLYEVGGAGGHTMSPTPSSIIPETGTDSVVSTINAQYNSPANDAVASLYSMSRWSNEKKVRRIMDGSASGSSIGSTGIGTWADKDVSQITTADEADWWQDNAFIIPDNSDDIDIDIKFDPSGDTVTLGGYILDTTTGKICIKFGNSVNPSTTRISVDIVYTRNEYS